MSEARIGDAPIHLDDEEVGDLALVEGAVGDRTCSSSGSSTVARHSAAAADALVVLRRGRAHLGGDALARGEIQAARALELGLRARDVAPDCG